MILFHSPDPFDVIYFPLKNFEFLVNEISFNTSLPTIIHTHGYQGSEADDSVVSIRKAYMDVGGYNVLTLDWSRYSMNANYMTGLKTQLKIVSRDKFLVWTRF